MRRLAVPVVLLSLLALAAPMAGHAATTPQRAQGEDRIGTAVELSMAAFASADEVVIASAATFADALAASPLAAAVGGPLLLTWPDTLPKAVDDELDRLGVQTVHLMGGTSAISASVATRLDDGRDVVRHAGDDRFETAALAADAAVARWRADGDADAGDHVLVALGSHPDPSRAWPDALAAGVLAGVAHRPILLVTPDGVPAATDDWFAANDPARVTVVGGLAAIPNSVRDDLGDGGTARDRIGGKDRFDTARLLALAAVDAGASPRELTLATGRAFPDALAAAAASVARGGVLVLVDGVDLDGSRAARELLESRAGAVDALLVAGGPAAIAEGTVGQAVRAVDGFTAPSLRLTQVASPGGTVLGVATAPGDGRLHAWTRDGRIFALGAGGWVEVADLSARVSTSGEGGLLGVAFPPDHGATGRFFAHYTGTTGSSLQTRLVEFTRRSTSTATSATERRLFSLTQPASNHNGGTVQVAPDGTLLLFLGDGGGSNDQYGHGQDARSPFAAVLRFDVSTPGVVRAPADNPYAGSAGDDRFVWMYGLRNPFRADVDPVTGLLHIADVGQGQWEEVDAVPWNAGRTNFGWSTMEGDHCFQASSCDTSGLTRPITEYSHADGCSITGGVVYRGRIGMLRGHFLYGDYCTGLVRSVRVVDGAAVEEVDWTSSLGGGQVWSFGRDASGEVYVSKGSTLYRIDPA